jgi:hypothetical protein
MTKIHEYNLATGHNEVLAEVEDDSADEIVNRLSDHSTDHVIYAEKVDEE